MADVFHTLFGVAGRYHVTFTVCAAILFQISMTYSGLSLLGYPGLEDIDPVYCMPAKLIEKMGLRKGWKALERRR